MNHGKLGWPMLKQDGIRSPGEASRTKVEPIFRAKFERFFWGWCILSLEDDEDPNYAYKWRMIYRGDLSMLHRIKVHISFIFLLWVRLVCSTLAKETSERDPPPFVSFYFKREVCVSHTLKRNTPPETDLWNAAPDHIPGWSTLFETLPSPYFVRFF